MSQSSYTLEQLGQQLDAQIEGDNQHRVNAIRPVQSAGPTALCFVMPRKKIDFDSINAGIVIVSPEDCNKFKGNKLIVDDPYLAFAQVSRLFDRAYDYTAKIEPSANIHASAKVANTAYIGPNVVIESGVTIGDHVHIGANSFIGADTTIGAHNYLHANVTIYHFVRTGRHVNIHSGAVLGADGFGFAPKRGGWQKIHQLGGVVIGDYVDIGANTTIDRGALDDTIIGSNVIIDNLVHIAHNVEIGDATAIAGCSAIAGSTKIGKNCIIAGRVSITGHLHIADNTRFNACAVITSSISTPNVYASASPMQDVSSWRRNAVRLTQLDSWVKRIKALEKALNINRNNS